MVWWFGGLVVWWFGGCVNSLMRSGQLARVNLKSHATTANMATILR